MYHLNPELHGGLCLSGTAELPLAGKIYYNCIILLFLSAGMYMNRTRLLEDLPIK